MKIGIDLNDVYRAFTSQFAMYYKKIVDRSFDIDNVEIWTNDLKQIFPFESTDQYLDFLYNDCPVEIFGSAQTMERNLASRFVNWVKELGDLDEIPEVCIVSTKEYDKSIGASLFFIGKYAIPIREIHMLMGEDLVWDKCDILVTANPLLLSFVPEGKIVVKINASYNQENEAEFTFDTFMEFLNDSEIIEKLNNKLNK
jgi:hypothetical protein